MLSYFSYWKYFKYSLLATLKIHNTVLLTIITIMCIRSPELICSWKFILLTFSQFLYHLLLVATILLCFYKVSIYICILVSPCKWYHVVLVFLCLTECIMPSRIIHVVENVSSLALSPSLPLSQSILLLHINHIMYCQTPNHTAYWIFQNLTLQSFLAHFSIPFWKENLE